MTACVIEVKGILKMNAKRKAVYVALFVCAAMLIVFLKSVLQGGGEAAARSDEQDSPGDVSMSITNPNREIRGVWIASVYNINFPSAKNLGSDVLMRELDEIVRSASLNGLNPILFQVRPMCDALYKSSLFPVSAVVSDDRTLPDGFDPLAYIIEAAHAEDIAVYAWINPFRVTTGGADSIEAALDSLPDTSPAKQNPEWCVFYNKQLLLNPGLPEVRKLVADGVSEIAEGYAVDGIIFDDYFYPYPAEGEIFDDSDAYALYGGGLEIGDFRRESVNALVKECYEAVKAYGTLCNFGVSPFGIWRNASSDGNGSETSGLQAYDSLYCDALAWAAGGYVDFLAPQIYWQFTNERAPYETLLNWWNSSLDGTSVKLLISHGTYNSAEWGTEGEIERQITAARQKLCYYGSLQYGYASIKANDMNLESQLSAVYCDEIIYSDPVSNGREFKVYTPEYGSSVNDGEVLISGISDPGAALSVDGKAVGRNKDGSFEFIIPLSPGKNTFEFTQGEKTYEYILYRN